MSFPIEPLPFDFHTISLASSERLSHCIYPIATIALFAGPLLNIFGGGSQVARSGISSVPKAPAIAVVATPRPPPISAIFDRTPPPVPDNNRVVNSVQATGGIPPMDMSSLLLYVVIGGVVYYALSKR
jgi:hypothetical protein